MIIVYILLIGVFIWGSIIAKNEDAVLPYIAGCLIGITFMFVIITHIKIKTPTSLDVYRGNTELKIASVNGIPTDTVVVFKNEKKHDYE